METKMKTAFGTTVSGVKRMLKTRSVTLVQWKTGSTMMLEIGRRNRSGVSSAVAGQLTMAQARALRDMLNMVLADSK